MKTHNVPLTTGQVVLILFALRVSKERQTNFAGPNPKSDAARNAAELAAQLTDLVAYMTTFES